MSRNTQNDCWKNFILRRLFSSPPEALFQPLSLSNTPYPRADTNEASSAPLLLSYARARYRRFLSRNAYLPSLFSRISLIIIILQSVGKAHLLALCPHFACTLTEFRSGAKARDIPLRRGGNYPMEEFFLHRGVIFPAPRDNFSCTIG